MSTFYGIIFWDLPNNNSGKTNLAFYKQVTYIVALTIFFYGYIKKALRIFSVVFFCKGSLFGCNYFTANFVHHSLCRPAYSKHLNISPSISQIWSIGIEVLSSSTIARATSLISLTTPVVVT